MSLFRARSIVQSWCSSLETSNQFELSNGTNSQSWCLATPSSVVCEFEKQTRTSVGEIVCESLFVLEIVNLTSGLIELLFGDLESIRAQ